MISIWKLFRCNTKKEIKMAGFEVEIMKKGKAAFGRVVSAFLKENIEAHDIKFHTRQMVNYDFLRLADMIRVE